MFFVFSFEIRYTVQVQLGWILQAEPVTTFRFFPDKCLDGWARVIDSRQSPVSTRKKLQATQNSTAVYPSVAMSLI